MEKINKRSNAITFTIIVLSASLILWGSLILFKFQVPNLESNGDIQLLPMFMYILNGFIPSIVGLILYFKQSKQNAKARLKTIIPNKNILKPAVIIVVLFIGLFVVQTLLYNLFVSKYDYSIISKQIYQLIPLILLGPISEEIGWRGYLQDQFSKKTPLKTSLIIGIIWAIWHYPLFYILGTTQQANNMSIITFTILVIAISIIMTHFYNKTNGNIFIAILIHYMYTVILTFYILGTTYSILGDIMAIIPVVLISVLLLVKNDNKTNGLNNKSKH